MKKNIKRYLKNVRFSFPIFRKKEKRFYDDFKQSINEYMEIHPECDADELANDFGNPKEVVIDYFNNLNAEEYLSVMKKSFYAKIAILITILLITSFFILQTILLFQATEAARNSIIQKQDTTIIYDD